MPVGEKTKLLWKNPNYRIMMSDSHKNQIPWNKGKKNPYSKEAIEKMVKNHTGMLGKHHSELTKRKKSEFHKRISQSSKFKEFHRELRLHQIFPVKDTSIELKMQDELSEREIGYYKHYPIIGQPDIAFPDRKIAIFADGTYWHKTERGLKRDAEVNEALRNQGWLVLRYSDIEINSNVEGVVDEIEGVI